jgi:excisionase family DNA binding protein
MESSTMLLNVDEAANTLRLSAWTVRLYVRLGKLRPVRIGRRVLFDPAELQRLVEAGREPRIPAPVPVHCGDDTQRS